jgi:hypothetical protein
MLTGEPGVGRSRLYHELMKSPRTGGWLVLVAGSVSCGKATSYLPVIDLLKGYFGVHAGDHQRAVREKVTGREAPAFTACRDHPIETYARSRSPVTRDATNGRRRRT